MTSKYSIKDAPRLKKELEDMNEVNIAELMKDLCPKDQVFISQLLTKDQLAEVFHLLPKDFRNSLLEGMLDPDIKELIDEVDSDDLVDSLQEMPANLVTKILNYFDSDKRSAINKLLRYPDGSVGSLMGIDYITAWIDSTPEELVAKIRQSQASSEHLTQIYLMDSNRHLVGYINLSDLIRLEGDDISDIIISDLESVRTGDDQEIASDLFMKYRLQTLPVVDSENRLVGLITADDIFEVISDEIYEDYASMGGISGTEKTAYLDTSIKILTGQRIKWLLFLMVSATITSHIIQRFEGLLAASVILTSYIPMLMDSGGNSGTQASTMVTRAISLHEVEQEDFFSVAWKEIRIGVLSGAVLALVNFVRITLMSEAGFLVSLTVSLALVVTVTLAKFIGGVLPMLAEKLGQDPAVMAGPLITTLVDALSLLVYFQLASLLLGL